MALAATAEELFQDLKRMPASERQKFFVLLSNNAFKDEDMSHEELFGHLSTDSFTADEAAEYLEVSMSTFRRYVTSGKIQPNATVGRNQLFPAVDLKQLKKAIRLTKS